MVRCEDVQEFFTKEIDPKVFAKILRKYNHEVVRMHMEMCKTDSVSVDTFTISDGLFWANEFAEMIDPYLDKEE